MNHLRRCSHGAQSPCGDLPRNRAPAPRQSETATALPAKRRTNQRRTAIPCTLETSAPQKRSGADEGAGRKILGEVSAINLVELFVQGEIGTKDLDGDQVVHGHIGGGESGLHPVEQQPNLLLDLFRRLAGLRIDADFPRQIESVADEHSVAVGQLVRPAREHDVSGGAGSRFGGGGDGIPCLHQNQRRRDHR